MRRRGWISGWSLRVLVPVVGVVVLAGTLPARAEARPDPVTDWVRHHAAPLTTVDPAAPLGDLTPLRRTTGDAEIVGLGESTHGAAEEIALKHRTLRLLVERMGFRSVAWEEDWTTGLQIDEYIRTGKGNLNALMRQMSPPVAVAPGGAGAGLAARLQRRPDRQGAVRRRRVLPAGVAGL